MLEKIDRFVYENVWYFQTFSYEVFAIWLIDKLKRISNDMLFWNTRFWKIWVQSKTWC